MERYYNLKLVDDYLDMYPAIFDWVKNNLSIKYEVFESIAARGETRKKIWKTPREDMLSVSIAFPYRTFSLHAKGLSRHDHWIEEYQNGKFRRKQVVIAMGEFGSWSALKQVEVSLAENR